MTIYKNKRYAALLLTFAVIVTAALGAVGVNADSSDYGSLKVCPGGIPFGVKFYTDGVIVTAIDDVAGESGVSSPARDAGIKLKDIITHIDGQQVNGASSVSKAVAQSNGKELIFTIMRDGESITVRLTPVKSTADGIFKAGLWLRDSTAGIGTVTFINPESGAFAGLGHGICDSDTGKLLPLMRGNVSNVRIGGVKRGSAGVPGELRGYFTGNKIGSLIGNTDCGVYGIFSEMIQGAESIAIGTKEEIHEGDAQIICTLDDSGPKTYKITVSSIDINMKGNKNFIVTVCDPLLIEKTGGIVQGMSGSPIIQDGKLVGAVTHVLINDPTRGYGILIENMLESMPDMLK